MLLLDLPLQNVEVWEQETNPSPISYRKEVNLKKIYKQNNTALLKTKPWVQAGAGDAAQPVVCTDCLLQKPSALHRGCKLPLVSKDQHSSFLLSIWRNISGRASEPRFPHWVIDYTLLLRRVDWFPGARKMIDEYFRPWASLPAGCPFHMSPMGLGTFFKTRKYHFYGYHPVIGTVHWAEALHKSKWNTKGQLKC